MATAANATVIPNNQTKGHAILVYALIGIGLFTAIPIIIGAVWAMIKRRNSLGTVYHSHYTNAIRVFWWSLLWTIVGGILIIAIIGYPILLGVWLWSLYRVVNGLAKILADTPYPIY